MAVTPSAACGADYPKVLNGQIVSGTETATSVEYECLSGFYMTGNKKIYCNGGVWDETPVCNVIDPSDKINVYPDWWLYVVAAVLGLMLLLCLLCIILYFCCCRGNTVHPYNDGYADDGCCSCCGRKRRRDVSVYDQNGYYAPPGRDGIYYIPVRQSQNRLMYHDGRRWSSNGATSSHATQTANGTSPQGYSSWNRESRDSKMWKDSFNTDTQTTSENGDIYSTHRHPNAIQPARPAKEVKAWLPHSKPVRPDHNTSTK